MDENAQNNPNGYRADYEVAHGLVGRYGTNILIETQALTAET
jgi:hypothetical protein